MRGLVIRQPFAGLFAAGMKVNELGETVEFRKSRVHIREEIAVQACPARGRTPCRECEKWTRRESYYRGNILVIPPSFCGPHHPNCRYMPREVVCLATLVDCRAPLGLDLSVPGCPDVADPEFARTWAWVFIDLRVLPKPVACKPPRGAQTWFTVPPEVEAEVLRQTAREGEGGMR